MDSKHPSLGINRNCFQLWRIIRVLENSNNEVYDGEIEKSTDITYFLDRNISG